MCSCFYFWNHICEGDLNFTIFCDRCCHRRWVSTREKSAPISSAPCAVGELKLKQTAEWGAGQRDAWLWQKWSLVSFRPDTGRRWEMPAGGSVWLPALFNARWTEKETGDCRERRTQSSLFVSTCLQFCCSCLVLARAKLGTRWLQDPILIEALYLFSYWLCAPQLSWHMTIGLGGSVCPTGQVLHKYPESTEYCFYCHIYTLWVSNFTLYNKCDYVCVVCWENIPAWHQNSMPKHTKPQNNHILIIYRHFHLYMN